MIQELPLLEDFPQPISPNTDWSELRRAERDEPSVRYRFRHINRYVMVLESKTAPAFKYPEQKHRSYGENEVVGSVLEAPTGRGTWVVYGATEVLTKAAPSMEAGRLLLLNTFRERNEGDQNEA